MIINIKYNNRFDSFYKEINLPYIHLHLPTKLSVDLQHLKYQSYMTNSIHDIYVGDTKLTLDNFLLDVESGVISSINLTNVLNYLVGIKFGNLIQDFDISNNYNIRLLNLMYSTNSQDKNNYFSSSAKVNIESIEFNKYMLGQFDLDFEISHINSFAFNQLINFFENIKDINQYNLQYNQLIDDLKVKFIPILIESPVFKLNKFNLNTNKGKIFIDGMITTKWFESIDITSQDLFLSKLYFITHFRIPKAVFSYLLIIQMKYFLSFGNAEIDKQSNQALSEVLNILLDNQIKVWKKKKYIKEDGEMISSSILFNQNKLFITEE